jgi:RNA polymerase sigma-54 factor
LSKTDYNAAKYIIESLNENGYLEDSTSYIAELLNINEEKIEEIVKIVQSFEPCGIGARNLKECLLIQLRAKGLESMELNVLIDNYLDDLGKNKFEYVSKHMKIPVERVKELFAIIKSLNPRPGAFLNRVENCGYIVPDVIVVKFRDYYEVLLSDFTIPTIKVSRLYKEILESTADEAAKKYIEKKITQANWIIKCIEQRNNTLLNVSKAIVDIQRRFFDKGPAHLCVMVLKDVADMIGIHESTVSRAVSGKYMQSPWGVYKISSFFTHGLSGGLKSGKTPQKIKSVINEIISDENKSKPYSDQRIAELLKERGIEMSRRTVSKYREEMNIPAASGRRD